jgi:hypothetical protein
MNINSSSYFSFQSHQISSSYDPTIDFFKYIYTYPPRISLNFKKLDDFSRFDNHSSNSLFFPTGETTKNISGTLSKDLKENRFVRALEVVPTYVILNGQRELITSSPYPNSSLEFDSRERVVIRKVKKFFSSSPSSPSRLGFSFMSRRDAEVYLNDVLSDWGSNSNTVGLAIHCVSLRSVYSAMCNDKVNIRIVPDMEELDHLLNKNKSGSDLIFDTSQHQLRRRFRALPFIPKLKSFYLGDKVTPFYKFVVGSDYFKGVPIYVVQVQNFPRNILVESGRSIFWSFDILISPITNVIGFLFGIGEKSVSEGLTQNLVKFASGDDYVFFNYQQAKRFLKRHTRSVRHFNRVKSLRPRFLVKESCIHVFNLEDYLEFKHLYASEKNSPAQEHAAQQVYFMPNMKVDKTFDNLWESYLETLHLKSKLFKSFLSNLLEI